MTRSISSTGTGAANNTTGVGAGTEQVKTEHNSRLHNAGGQSLSKLAANNAGRKRRIHYSSKKRVRAAQFFAGLLGAGGRQTTLGRFWRKASHFVAAGLVIAGVALSATGIGAAVGVPLLIAGSALGCANSARNMLDLYVEQNVSKENGGDGVKHYGWKMAANALGLVLSATPFLGAAGLAIGSASGAVGNVANTLAQVAPHAMATGASSAASLAAGSVATMHLAQGMKESVSPEFDKRDRAENEISVRTDNPDFSCVDPVSGNRIDKVADFVDTISSKAHCVNMTAPGSHAPVSTSAAEFGKLLQKMDDKQVFNLLHLKLVNELMDQPLDSLQTLPGLEPAQHEPRSIWQLKCDLVKNCTNEAGFHENVYKREMERYKDTAIKFWNSHDEECDMADQVLDNLRTPLKNNRTLNGTFIDPTDGGDVGIALDLSDDNNPCFVATAPGIPGSGSSTKDQDLLTGRRRVGLELKNQFAGPGRDNFNSFADFAADVRRASSGIFPGDSFATAGLCQGGGKAAFASAKIDAPAYVWDARPLGSGTVDHLISDDCDYQEVQARWQRNLVSVQSEGDGLSAGRGLRGGAIGNQVSYPNQYVMDVPSKRDRTVFQALRGKGGSGHHVSSFKDSLYKVWHEGDRERKPGDTDLAYQPLSDSNIDTTAEAPPTSDVRGRGGLNPGRTANNTHRKPKFNPAPSGDRLASLDETEVRRPPIRFNGQGNYAGTGTPQNDLDLVADDTDSLMGDL